MNPVVTIKPELLTLTADQIAGLMPYIWVLGGLMLMILLAVLRIVKPKWPVFLAMLATCAAGIAACAGLVQREAIPLFNGMMVSDPFANVFGIIFLASAALTAMASFRYLDREEIQHPEYYLMILFSAVGMMLMASSLDLIVIFIALELMSLAVYILVAYRRADRRCNEASVKYFILGGAASAVLLYGVSLLYGATASTNIREVLAFARAVSDPSLLFVAGAGLTIAGLLFKVAAVPFHMWTPDVYEGAPIPVTGFMTTGVKAAAFAAFLRIFVSTGYGAGLAAAVEAHIHDVLWICAVLTMVLGNVVAVTQNNLKRMLAYSSIAHTGYVLVGLLAGSSSSQGYAPIVLYLVAYAMMNLGAFVVLAILASRGDEGVNLHDLSGTARRHPWLAAAMAVFLLSMAGVPPTAGFVAKYLLFYAAIQAGETALVVIGVLCSAISVYYYLRVLVYMYMRDPLGSEPSTRVSLWSAAAVASMMVMTLQVGMLPAGMVELAKRAVTLL